MLSVSKREMRLAQRQSCEGARAWAERLEQRLLLSGAVDPTPALAGGIEAGAGPTVVVITPPAGGDVVRAPANYTIQWTARDPFGLSLAISLYYDFDNTPGGEVPIATNLPNTGSFDWSVPTGLIGDSLFVKVLASEALASGFAYSPGELTIRRPSLPPVVSLGGISENFTLGGSPVLVAPQAMLSDGDSNNFDGGTLIARVANPQGTDQLAIRSLGPASEGITTQPNTEGGGGSVFYLGTFIGNYGGGRGEAPLSIRLSSDATVPAVQSLIHNITYSNGATTVTSPSKAVQISLSDGAGGISQIAVANIGNIIRLPFPPTNYAVLFAGGGDADHNHVRYYNNVKALYQTLVNQYGLSPSNIWVLYADGTNPAADQNPDTGGANINSDMSFAAGAHVMSANWSNLNTTLNQVANTVWPQDYFMFWSFDHGGGAYNVPSNMSEQLIGYGSNISDTDLASWLSAIHTAHSTYVHTQCFSGGMQDDIQATLTGSQFSMAATNHYEYSFGDGFASAFHAALANGYKMTRDAYAYAFRNDPYATDGEGPGGTVKDSVEHPWSIGSNFRIFYPQNESAPTITGPIVLANSFFGQPVVYSYGLIQAFANPVDPDGDQSEFRIESVDSGTLLKNGVPVTPGVTMIGYGDSVLWYPPAFSDGLLDAFTVRAWDGIKFSSNTAQAQAFTFFNFLSGGAWGGGGNGDSMHFGAVPLGMLSTPLNFPMSNPGVDPLTITLMGGTLPRDFSFTVLGADGRPVAISGKGQFQIPPGTAFTLQARFEPNGPGGRGGSINFTTSDPNDKVVHTVNFDGAGVYAQPPTLTKIATLTGAFIGQPFTITHKMLLSASDASDVDPSTQLRFRIEAVLGGTLTLDGQPVIPGSTIMDIGGHLAWTSPSGAAPGVMPAFSVTAIDDNNLDSGQPVTVNVRALQAVKLFGGDGGNVRLLMVAAANNMFEVFDSDPPGPAPIFSAPLSRVGSFEFDGGLGNDTLIIASPLPFTPIFHGDAGKDALVVRAGSFTYPYDIRAETDVMSLSVSGGATVNLGANQEFSLLDIGAGSRVNEMPNGIIAILIGLLRMAKGAVLDLNDNAMVLQSTAELRQSEYNQVFNLIASARNVSPLWGGPGITSTAAAQHPLMGLAAMINDSDQAGTIVSMLNGQPAGINDVVVKYALNGDTNLDGIVNFDDYFQVNTGFLSNTLNLGYRWGDFNYDRVINFDDYFLLNTAFLGQSAAAAASPAAFGQAPISQSVAPVSRAAADSAGQKLLSTRRRGGHRHHRGGHAA